MVGSIGVIMWTLFSFLLDDYSKARPGRSGLEVWLTIVINESSDSKQSILSSSAPLQHSLPSCEETRCYPERTSD